MARSIDYTALSDLQLINAINSARPAEGAVNEMRTRSGGVLPFAGGKIVSDAAVKFLKHVHDLRSNGKTYSGGEYRGVKLVALAAILAAPKVKLVCEPFTGHELEGDGTDPQTELSYPVADADRMNRLAWIAERLPSMTTVNLADLDWQQTVMDMLNSGSLKPNLRKLMKDYDNADEDERKAVAKRLKPEFWSGVEQAPAAPAQRQPVAVQEIGKLPDAMDERPAPPPPQVIEGPRPVHMHIVGSYKDLDMVIKLRKHLYVATNVRKRISLSTFEAPVEAGNVALYREQMYAKADVFVYMLSMDALSECGQEIDELMRRFRGARHVPVLCRPTHIQGMPIASLVSLPRNNKPIASWSNTDEALFEVGAALSSIADAILAQRPL
mgnify:FL=1